MLTGTLVNLLVRLTRTDILMPSNHEHGTQRKYNTYYYNMNIFLF